MTACFRSAGLVSLLAYVFAAPAQADTFKCLDANGRATYTNVKEEAKGKNCTIVMREISIVPANPPARPAAASSSPAGFPKVDAATQKSRDSERRRILEEELAGEQKSLTQAQAELGEQEKMRTGAEIRNYQLLQDRLQKYKDEVQRHEKNVEALKKELSNVK